MAVYRRINKLLSFTAAILFIIISYIIQRKNSQKNNFALVDFRQPPRCVDSLRESIRLNELLAYTQFICQEKIRLPDELHAFQLCLDPKIGVDLNEELFFLSISNSFDDFELEFELFRLSNGTGVIVSPKTREEPKNLQNKNRLKHFSGVLVPSDSSDRDDESRKYLIPSDLHKYLSTDKRKIDIFKLDCTNCWQLTDNPKLLLELIQLNLLENVKQLHLVVRLQGNVDNLLYQWYLALHTLYYQTKFALYSAVQLGECGRVIMHCQYKLSFVKIPTGGAWNVLAPINGMGFPEEEIGRLISYINARLNLCPTNNLAELRIGKTTWHICSPGLTMQHHCTVYYFMYNSGIDSRSTFDNNNNCQLFFFDPVLTDDLVKSSHERVQFHKLTLADKKSGSIAPGIIKKGNEWPLATLSQVLDKLNHKETVIDILILDLNGGEWDTFEDFLSNNLTKNFKHILIKLRIWFGEENENYRQLYSWFIRLEDAGWNLVDSRPFSLGDNDNCDKNSCYVLNLKRNV